MNNLEVVTTASEKYATAFGFTGKEAFEAIVEFGYNQLSVKRKDGEIMLANYHTHTTFCDGKNTAEEIVKAAIEKGFSAIGFSGHGYTNFDLRYCMQDTEGYLSEINRLKREYGNQIQIYAGIEEDAGCPVDRGTFDYIIGSSHYFCVNGIYYPIDSGAEYFKKCLEVFDYDVERFTEAYYQPFCRYIKERKPDIVGHFDLITKFDETSTDCFLKNPAYLQIAEKYLSIAAENDVLFEVNTGAIARGLRTTPYPQEHLLYQLKRKNAKLILSSDCHQAELLDAAFPEIRKLLKEIGFQYVYVLYDQKFQKDYLAYDCFEK